MEIVWKKSLTKSLNLSDKQQTSLDGIDEAKIDLKEMKENSPNILT